MRQKQQLQFAQAPPPVAAGAMPPLGPERQLSIAFTIDEIIANGEDPGTVLPEFEPRGAGPPRQLTTAEAAAAFAAGGAPLLAGGAAGGGGGGGSAGAEQLMAMQQHGHQSQQPVEAGQTGLGAQPLDRTATLTALYDGDAEWLQAFCSDDDTEMDGAAGSGAAPGNGAPGNGAGGAAGSHASAAAGHNGYSGPACFGLGEGSYSSAE
jgi:hypothetical protein